MSGTLPIEQIVTATAYWQLFCWRSTSRTPSNSSRPTTSRYSWGDAQARGHVIQPHVHKPVPRKVLDGYEALFIARVASSDVLQRPPRARDHAGLRQGDCILL